MIVINVGGEQSKCPEVISWLLRIADTAIPVGGKSFGTTSKLDTVRPQLYSAHISRLH